MKAIVYTRYGSADVLELRDEPTPAPGENQALVRVHAAALNPQDWHFMTGTPYVVRIGGGLRAPKVTRLGSDLAGRVEALGPGVTSLSEGDEVFGLARGAFAEFVCAGADSLARKPPTVSFEHAAAAPVAALTALQALRDKGLVSEGRRVLINGASGGVGTYAVQIAASLGAEVTAVCSTRNVELVRSLGADRVIDYTTQDFTAGDPAYDVIVDVAGNRPLSACRRLLVAHGRMVIVGGPKTNKLIGPLSRLAKGAAMSTVGSRKVVPMLTRPTRQDLTTVADLLGSGRVRSVVDRTYPLSELSGAMRYLEQGHVRGKLVVSLANEAG